MFFINHRISVLKLSFLFFVFLFIGGSQAWGLGDGKQLNIKAFNFVKQLNTVIEATKAETPGNTFGNNVFQTAKNLKEKFDAFDGIPKAATDITDGSEYAPLIKGHVDTFKANLIIQAIQYIQDIEGTGSSSLALDDVGNNLYKYLEKTLNLKKKNLNLIYTAFYNAMRAAKTPLEIVTEIITQMVAAKDQPTITALTQQFNTNISNVPTTGDEKETQQALFEVAKLEATAKLATPSQPPPSKGSVTPETEIAELKKTIEAEVSALTSAKTGKPDAEQAKLDVLITVVNKIENAAGDYDALREDVRSLAAANTGNNVLKPHLYAVWKLLHNDDPTKKTPMGGHSCSRLFSTKKLDLLTDEEVIVQADELNKENKIIKSGNFVQLPALYQAYPTQKKYINLCGWYSLFFLEKLLPSKDIKEVKEKVNDRNQFTTFFEAYNSHIKETDTQNISQETLYALIQANSKLKDIVGTATHYAQAKVPTELTTPSVTNDGKIAMVLHVKGSLEQSKNRNHWIASIFEFDEVGAVRMIMADSLGINRVTTKDQDPIIDLAYKKYSKQLITWSKTVPGKLYFLKQKLLNLRGSLVVLKNKLVTLAGRLGELKTKLGALGQSVGES